MRHDLRSLVEPDLGPCQLQGRRFGGLAVGQRPRIWELLAAIPIATGYTPVSK